MIGNPLLRALRSSSSKQARVWVLAGLSLWASACGSIQRPTAQMKDSPPSAADGAARQVAAREERPAAGAMRRDGAVRPAGFEGAAPTAAPRIERLPLGPREATAFDCPPLDGSPESLAQQFPDEYLFDGGDRSLPVHFEDRSMLGFDTEDALIEYRDESNKRHVRPSNRVAIYSPRFAAVTQISAPIEDVGGNQATQVVSKETGIGLRNREVTVAENQNEDTERLVSRSRASGMAEGLLPAEVDQPLAAQRHVHTLRPHTDFTFLRTGVLTKGDLAVVARGVQAAAVWSRTQNPVIAAVGEGPVELLARFHAAELDGHENRFNGKGRLRIVKLADKSIAEAGETITFTIRFDNIGDREVREVVIADNLTPRLEYIEDSATCDLAGRLVTEDNGEGSLILRWELDEPLAGRTGGVVTFQARVR